MHDYPCAAITESLATASTEANNIVTLDASKKKKGSAHIMPQNSKLKKILYNSWTNRLFHTTTNRSLIKSMQVVQGKKGFDHTDEPLIEHPKS